MYGRISSRNVANAASCAAVAFSSHGPSIPKSHGPVTPHADGSPRSATRSAQAASISIAAFSSSGGAARHDSSNVVA